MHVKDHKKPDVFSRMYVLGGSPCSGKSTIAGKLAKRFALHYYNVDDHYNEHVERSNPVQHPVMVRYAQMGWNQIWTQPVAVQVNDELQYYRELFDMIVQDLRGYDLEKAIIVEGAALLPELIVEMQVDPQKVLYMVPTKDFQLHHYSQRDFIHQILKDCDDPEDAWQNWMMRDYLFGKEILRQAERFGFRTMLVDGARSIEEQFELVRETFGLR